MHKDGQIYWLPATLNDSLNHSIMTRKNQEDRRSHLLEKYRRIQRQKERTKKAPKGLSKKHKGFRVLKKTKSEAKTEAKPTKAEAKPVAKPEGQRPAALPATVGDTIFISVMKPAAQFS